MYTANERYYGRGVLVKEFGSIRGLGGELRMLGHPKNDDVETRVVGDY